MRSSSTDPWLSFDLRLTNDGVLLFEDSTEQLALLETLGDDGPAFGKSVLYSSKPPVEWKNEEYNAIA